MKGKELSEIILESVRRDMARCSKKKIARYKTWSTAIQIAIKYMQVQEKNEQARSVH